MNVGEFASAEQVKKVTKEAMSSELTLITTFMAQQHAMNSAKVCQSAGGLK